MNILLDGKSGRSLIKEMGITQQKYYDYVWSDGRKVEEKYNEAGNVPGMRWDE